MKKLFSIIILLLFFNFANAESDEVLLAALKANNVCISAELARFGDSMDFNIKDEDGKTMLDYLKVEFAKGKNSNTQICGTITVQEGGFLGVANNLLKNGLDYSSLSNQDKINIINYSLSTIKIRGIDKTKYMNFVDGLIEKNIIILKNFSNMEKTDLLFFAITNQNFDFAKQLLEAGADINAVGKSKVSTSEYLTKSKNQDLLKFALSHGASGVNSASLTEQTISLGSYENSDLLIELGNISSHNLKTDITFKNKSSKSVIVEYIEVFINNKERRKNAIDFISFDGTLEKSASTIEKGIEVLTVDMLNNLVIKGQIDMDFKIKIHYSIDNKNKTLEGSKKIVQDISL